MPEHRLPEFRFRLLCAVPAVRAEPFASCVAPAAAVVPACCSCVAPPSVSHHLLSVFKSCIQCCNTLGCCRKDAVEVCSCVRPAATRPTPVSTFVAPAYTWSVGSACTGFDGYQMGLQKLRLQAVLLRHSVRKQFFPVRLCSVQ